MQLGGLLAEVIGVAEQIDVEALSSADATTIVSSLSPVIRQLVALRDACAVRSSQGPAWVASQLDVSQVDARRTLAMQSQLRRLPDVQHAVRSGALSVEKAAVITRASSGDEQVAAALLQTASVSTFEQLRRAVQERSARESSAEKRKRLRNSQYIAIEHDDDNMVLGRFRLLPEVAAPWLAQWSKVERQAVSHNEELEEPLDDGAARAEAFAGLLASGGGAGKSISVINYHVDHAAFERGFTEGSERCELAGVGPVPVSVINEALPHSPIRLLMTQHNKLVWYSEERRSKKKSGVVPDFIKRAVKAEAYGMCEVEGCLGTADEVDHVNPRCNNGSDDLDNLSAKCKAHHDEKTMTEAPWTKLQVYGRRRRQREEREQHRRTLEQMKRQVLQPPIELFPE
jgi:5-methylcytosine-specific restriction endonuclease McrA